MQRKKTKAVVASNKESPLINASTASASGSTDPRVIHATLRKKMLSKKTKAVVASNKESSLINAQSNKPLSRKPAGILDQFKDGRLNSDSDDEELAPVQLQTQTPVSGGQDTEVTLDLAERAVASLVEAAVNGAAAGARRSGRAPKPKDFGDVEVHGWKTKRARTS